jgi:hypothetical protein
LQEWSKLISNGAIEGASVIYRGVQFTVVATAEPDVWEWRYEYGGQIKTGRTQTRLGALAARRVRSKIDAAMRAMRPNPAHSDTIHDHSAMLDHSPMPAALSGR